ncbi:MAG: PilX N-terminal domain-containing pilus assembly protein [Candidatus Deferrimicrobium sp.]
MNLSNERGSALIITLMLLLILTAIGIYAISISTTEMSIALQSKTGTATLNTAESGAHYAIDKIPTLVTNDNATLADQSRYSVSSLATGGMTLKPGFGTNYRFADFMADSTGTAPSSFVAQRRLQAVVIFGPVPVGTMY